MREAIDEAVLKALIDGRGVSDFLVTRNDNGFVLNVRYTGATRWLSIRSRREVPRTWANLSTLARHLERLGVRKFSVEL
jgi:hypothetical protein